MKKVGMIALVIGALLTWRIFHHSGQIATELLTGWISFLRRVFPTITWRWDGVVLFLCALVAFSLLVHYLLRCLRPAPADAAAAPAAPWPVRWTLCIVAVTMLMFVGGIAMIGVTHQTVWLATRDEPLFVGVMKPWGGSSASSTLNLRMVHLGIELYHDNFQRYPSNRPHKPGVAAHSWVTRILPNLGYSVDDVDYTRPWNDPANARCFRAIVPQLINPDLLTDQIVDRDGFGLNHYAGNSHFFNSTEKVTWERVANRPSQTIVLGEVNAEFEPWGQPGNCRDPLEGIGVPGGFGGPSGSGGAQFLMSDGSVRLITADIDRQVLRTLSTLEDAQGKPSKPQH